MKVKDLANEFGKKPKDFIKLLLEFDIRVKSENTRLDDDTITAIKELFNEDKAYIEEKIAETKSFNLNEEQIKLSEFATLIDTPIKDILGVIIKKGLLLNINSIIDSALAKDIATDLEIKLTLSTSKQNAPSNTLKDQINDIKAHQDKASLRSRPHYYSHGACRSWKDPTA